MAKRRMFSIDMMESDSFCTMTPSAQILYVHLMLNADDDGFVDNWKSLLRYLRIESKHYATLKARGLVLETDSGVALIADWHGHNTIRRDRYIPTRFPKELESFSVGADGRYFKKKEALLVDNCAPESREDKNREEKNISEKKREDNKREGITTNNHSYIQAPDGAVDKHSKMLSSLNMTEENYRLFINKVCLYFMRVYKTLDTNDFINYFTEREWKNKRGEIIVDSFSDYVDAWMLAKKEDASNDASS